MLPSSLQFQLLLAVDILAYNIRIHDAIAITSEQSTECPIIHSILKLECCGKSVLLRLANYPKMEGHEHLQQQTCA